MPQALQKLQEARARRPLVAPEGSAARAVQQPSAEQEGSAQLVAPEAPAKLAQQKALEALVAPAVVARTAGWAPPECPGTMLPSGYCC